MKYFLAKTDPETYSIGDFEKDGETVWDGVHNFQAIACIKKWKVGDLVFIYHSQGLNSIVGVAEVVSDPYENKSDPRTSSVAKLKFEKMLKTPVTLKEIKESGKFLDFKLVTNSRLSTMECTNDFVEWMKDKI
jgi:predicted RNA-binding protein with PUA-like domain